MGRKYKDLSNQKFGELTALYIDDTYAGGKGKAKKWICKCSCGNVVSVRASHLLGGDTQRCIVCRNNAFKATGIKHGYSGERLYQIWLGMRKRCYNSKNNDYKRYGGRGIEICKDWGAGSLDITGYLSFKKWALENGYNNTLSIDRIDVNGPYSPNNCRWADFKTQTNNKRNTISLTVDGISKPLVEWAKEYKMNEFTLRRRIKNGWDHKTAVTTQVQ